MKKATLTACLIMLVALLALPLAACSGSKTTGSTAAASGSLDEGVKQDIKALVAKARENSFDNVTFTMKTETTATIRDTDGNQQQQVTTSATSGELVKSSDNPAIHMHYESSSNVELEKTTYDMYIDKTGMTVSQSGQLFKNAVEESTIQNYITSVTGVGTEAELDSLFDVASSYSMKKQENGDTLVTIVADVKKLADSSVIDTSSLPEGSSIATLVSNYLIDSDNHFKTVRLISSTSGSPTYRVDQSYQFSNYNTTKLPEWPDIQSYVKEQMNIQTDASGRMYIVSDGQTYYIDSIGDDGTINYADTSSSSSSTSDYYYDSSAYEDSSSSNSGSTSSSSSSSSGSSSSNAGRASITVDGKRYWLDEEGARVVDVGSGMKLFYPADGSGPYFISEE